MSFLESILLAFGMIRAQKLKSFFSLIGAFIGVTFLIGVVTIVNGMDRYMKEDFAGKLFGINTFTLRYRPFVNVGQEPSASSAASGGGGRASRSPTTSSWRASSTPASSWASRA